MQKTSQNIRIWFIFKLERYIKHKILDMIILTSVLQIFLFSGVLFSVHAKLKSIPIKKLKSIFEVLTFTMGKHWKSIFAEDKSEYSDTVYFQTKKIHQTQDFGYDHFN